MLVTAAPSQTPEAAGLEVVQWEYRTASHRQWHITDSRKVAEQERLDGSEVIPRLVRAASAQAAIDAEKARADRLAKDATVLLAEISSFGRAFMTAQESLSSASTPDAYDDAILAASARYQSMVKTASALYRAALQQETQP